MMEFIVLGYVPGTNIQISFGLIKNMGLLITTLIVIYIDFKLSQPKKR